MLSVHHAAQHCPTIKIVLILVYSVVPLKEKEKKKKQAMVCLLFPGSILIKYLTLTENYLCVK